MNDKLTITLNIAGRPCVLTIEREEEEEIRKAAQLINSKIAKYREKYATADPVDFLAVTALQFTVKMLEAERLTDLILADQLRTYRKLFSGCTSDTLQQLRNRTVQLCH